MKKRKKINPKCKVIKKNFITLQYVCKILNNPPLFIEITHVFNFSFSFFKATCPAIQPTPQFYPIKHPASIQPEYFLKT